MCRNEMAGKTQGVLLPALLFVLFPRLSGSVPCVGRNRVSLPLEHRAPVCERGSFRASDF